MTEIPKTSLCYFTINNQKKVHELTTHPKTLSPHTVFKKPCLEAIKFSYFRDPPQNRGHIQTESEGLEKIFQANRDQKKVGVAILISDKIDFKKML